MPWNMFWTITWQVVLFALVTAVPLMLWVGAVCVWRRSNKIRGIYRG